MLESEELFAGKIKAMIDRRHPRDLYDLFRFANSRVPYNPDTLRKLAVLFSSTMDRDLRTYGPDRFDAIDQGDLDRLLYPLLRSDDRPTASEMLGATLPLLTMVLDRESAYLDAMALGRYQPELLLPGRTRNRRAHSSPSRPAMESGERRSTSRFQETPLGPSSVIPRKSINHRARVGSQ